MVAFDHVFVHGAWQLTEAFGNSSVVSTTSTNFVSNILKPKAQAQKNILNRLYGVNGICKVMATIKKQFQKNSQKRTRPPRQLSGAVPACFKLYSCP